MGIVRSLSLLALHQVARGAAQAAGLAGVESVARFLGRHFTDHSQRLVASLRGANERAWQALEVALAGESLWGKLDEADDRAFRQQVRVFLDAAPLAGLPSHGAEFRQQALRELRAARKAGLLLTGPLVPDDLADAAGLARLDGSGLLEEQWRSLEALAEPLRQAGHSALAQLVSLRPSQGEPLLVVAVRYFFHRAVEADEELFRGLAWTQWEALAEGQQRGFDQLTDALHEHGRRLEEVLDVLTEVRAVVLDLRKEIAGQREQIQRLADDVLRVLGQHQLERRELRPGDSLSLRTDEERRLVRDLVTRYRSLPEDQRRQLPALLNAVGKMEVVVGNFESARRDFAQVAGMAASHADRAEAHFNAYQAALECRQWDEALAALRQAVALDPGRFTPFPLGKYEPERILGAGGFGVAFLCRDRHSGSRVVIKTLRADGLDRPVAEVFAEARVLEEVEHPGIIRLRYCDYAGSASTRPYLVMDYFEAPTLADYVARNGPLPAAEALALMRTVAEALQAAHNKNICHRDVKPANILVRREAPSGEPGGTLPRFWRPRPNVVERERGEAEVSQDPQWQVRLIDFGLALKANVMQATMAASHAQARTLVGSSVAGTLDYAAPEQLGKLPGVAVGPYSDVYGLAKTCCFALFGTTMPLPKHWRSLSQEVADLLGQCLAEDPKERPAGCADLLRRLPAEGAAPPRAEAPVAAVVPVAAVAPAAAPLPAPGEMQPGLRALIGGVLGLVGGTVSGAAYLRTTPDTAALAFLLILVGSGVVCGMGAALGRNWAAHPPTRLRPVGPALLLVLGIALLGPVVLWILCVRQSDYPSNVAGNYFIPAIVGVLLEAGLSFVCGWKLKNTVGPIVLGGLIAAVGVFAHSPAFGIAAAIICAVAALGGVAAPIQTLDRNVDEFVGSCLEYLGRSRRRAAPSPEPAADLSATPRSTLGLVGRTVWLALPLLVGGFVGVGVGVHSGASGLGISPSRRNDLIYWLIVPGALAGGLAGLLLRPRLSLFGVLWLAGGALLGLGSGALVMGVSWEWLNTPLALMLALGAWGGFLGALWGLSRHRPLAGALVGTLLAGVVAVLGGNLAHPDPAGLFGAVVGMAAGTLVWRGLRPGRLWLARLGVIALAVATGMGLVALRAGSTPARLFIDTHSGSYYSPPSRPIQPVFSPRGDRLLTLSSTEAHLWDVAGATQLRSFPLRFGTPAGLAFAEDGTPLCISTDGPTLKKANVETGELLAGFTSPPPLQMFASLATLSPNGTLALCSDGRNFWVTDLTSGKMTTYETKDLQQPTALALAPSGRQVLTGSQDGTIRLWDLKPAEQGKAQARLLHTYGNVKGSVRTLVFSNGGARAFALTDSNPSLWVWDVEAWRNFREVDRGTP
jgi:hypothetical protein